MITDLLNSRDLPPLARPFHIAIAGSCLIALDVAARLLPHLPNSTPLAASGIFAGFLMRSRGLAICIPLIALLISDQFIGSYDWRVMTAVYGSIALPALLGRFGRARYSVFVLGGIALGGSLLFFIVTNTAVWLFSGMCSTDLDGLIRCYVAALPFLRPTVQGDLLWTILLWSVFATARAGLSGLRLAARPA